MCAAPGADYRAALEAVSYKRELILVTTRGSLHLEFFFQLHAQLMRLGLAHFLALSVVRAAWQRMSIMRTSFATPGGSTA